MRKLRLAEYQKISPDYRGVYTDHSGKRPDLKGRRTILTYDGGRTVMEFEGIHFEVIPDSSPKNYIHVVKDEENTLSYHASKEGAEGAYYDKMMLLLKTHSLLDTFEEEPGELCTKRMVFRHRYTYKEVALTTYNVELLE